MASMERRLAVLVLGLYLIAGRALYGQELKFDRKIRMPLWAEIDAFPGITETDREDDIAAANDGNVFSYASLQIRKLTPYLINGMVYGWEFSYTPYDSLRGVQEKFTVKEVRSFDEESKNIVYESPWFSDEKVHVWVSYERTKQQQLYFKHWQNIQNPRVIGIGKGRLEKGFEGIQDACDMALKDAVREYYRKIIPNKPKLITGRVIVNKVPAILIERGQYKVQLDFFLETVKIKEYSQF